MIGLLNALPGTSTRRHPRGFTGSITRGFTMIEIMITLIIAVILVGAGYMTLTGLLPKQRLVATANLVQQMVMRAQSEAHTQAQRTGLQFSDIGSGQIRMEVYIDNGATAFTRDAGESALLTTQFKTDVTLETDACNDLQLSATCGAYSCGTVFFNGGGEATDGAGNTTDWQIFIVNNGLGAGYKAREIEVLANGSSQVVPLGQSGGVVTNAKQANADCPP